MFTRVSRKNVCFLLSDQQSKNQRLHLLSHMTKKSRKSLKTWMLQFKDTYFKKKVSEMSFLHRVTGTGWGAGTFRVSSKESHCSFVLKEVSWGGLVIWLGCLLGSSLWRFSWARPLGGDPRVDPEIAGGIIYLLFSEHLGIPKEEQESIAWEMNAWNTLLSLLPPWPGPRFFLEEKWKINGLSNTFYFNLLFARVEILVITYVPSQTLSLFVEL